MPELALACGGEEYACAWVSVRAYRKYTEIMERSEGCNAREALECGMEILRELFRMPSGKLRKADAAELLAAVKEVHYVMQDIVTPKFLELSRGQVQEQEKSAFDAFDEEEGYNDILEPENVWKVCRENTDRVVKLCIRAFHDSYTQCMETDIMSLLDYVVFEIAAADGGR